MPGHVKLGKTGEPDPDPSPYLVVSMEMKREAMVSFLVLICIWEVCHVSLSGQAVRLQEVDVVP